jgi:hypothetical protein
VRETPVLALEAGAFGLEARLVLKLELLQHTGSFKPRGAFNRLLSAAVPATGVIAASGGNHSAAVAYAARQLGHRAEIFVPTIASPVKSGPAGSGPSRSPSHAGTSSGSSWCQMPPSARRNGRCRRRCGSRRSRAGPRPWRP